MTYHVQQRTGKSSREIYPRSECSNVMKRTGRAQDKKSWFYKTKRKSTVYYDKYNLKFMTRQFRLHEVALCFDYAIALVTSSNVVDNFLLN